MRMASQNVFSLEQMLHGIGVLVVLWLLLKSLWVLAHVLRTHVLSERWKGVDLASYGPWAVVTGATSGIGKAYAHELARRGLNVVLISRSLEKLRQVAAGIEERHGQSTRVIQADFTRGSELYEPIRAALEGLEIGILVNNVGQAPTGPMLFLDMNDVDKFTQDLVHCNMLSYVKMTQLILPQMVARKKGIIINMSSTAAHVPSPLLLTYGATKAFDDFFSQALNMEYRSKGILVQSVLPMIVESNLSIPFKNCWKLPAETFAHEALNTVGLTDRTNGCLNQFIQDSILSMIPDSFRLSPLGLSALWFLWRNVLRQRQ